MVLVSTPKILAQKVLHGWNRGRVLELTNCSLGTSVLERGLWKGQPQSNEENDNTWLGT